MRNSIVSIVAAALVTADWAMSQNERGMASAWAIAYSRRGATPGPVHVAQPGTTNLGQSFAAGPQYTLSAIFAAVPGAADLVDIDAMSTGNDFLPLDEAGVIRPGPVGGAGMWAALYYSVTSGTVGESGQTHPYGIVDKEAAMFGYYAFGSQGLADELIDQPLLEQTRSENGMPVGSDLDGLDIALPVLAQGGPGPRAILIAQSNAFYFSLTANSALALAPLLRTAHTLAQTTGWTEPPVAPLSAPEWQYGLSAPNYYKSQAASSGATVFVCQWNSSSGTWSLPDVAWAPMQLRLSHSAELDALGIDTRQSSVTPWIAYSTASAPLSAQLLVAKPGHSLNANGLPNTSGFPNPALPVPLRIQIGSSPLSPPENVTSRLRLSPTADIDAICGQDPEAMMFDSWLGTAWANLEPSRPMSLSVTRFVSPDSQHFGVFTVFGWGGMPPQSSQVRLQLYGGGGTLLWTSNPLDRTAAAFGVEFVLPALPAPPVSAPCHWVATCTSRADPNFQVRSWVVGTD